MEAADSEAAIFKNESSRAWGREGANVGRTRKLWTFLSTRIPSHHFSDLSQNIASKEIWETPQER